MTQEEKRTTLITDTSWFVDHGRNALGALSKLNASLLAPGISAAELLVPKRIASEYAKLHEVSAQDQHGIPLTISYYARTMHDWCPSEEPKQYMIAAWSLWKDNSKKASRGVRLSYADQAVLAHLIKEVREGKECYILSGDEDITGSGKALAETFPNAHVVEETPITLEDASRRSFTANPNPRAPVILSPEALGALYNIPASSQPEYYLLCAKVPYGGKTQEVGVSVHPMGKSLSFEDNDAKRYPVLVMDLQDVYDGSEQRSEMLDRVVQSRFRHMDEALRKRFRTFNAIEIGRSRAHGLFEASRYEKTFAIEKNGLFTTEESSDLPWFLITPGYTGRNAPETGYALANFYGRHHEEMRTALRRGV